MLFVFQDVKPCITISFTGCEVMSLERSEHEHSFEVSTFLGEKHAFAAEDSQEKERWINYIINFNAKDNTVQTFFD